MTGGHLWNYGQHLHSFKINQWQKSDEYIH